MRGKKNMEKLLDRFNVEFPHRYRQTDAWTLAGIIVKNV